VAKQTAILRRVAIWQRCFFILLMAFKAEFFSLLFTFDVMEAAMDVIVGKRGGRFFGSVEEEDKDACADNHK
jgi:hypothetical protein